MNKPPPLANLPDYFKPLELCSPPTFDGVPRRLIVAPIGFFCPCCAIEKARPMFEQSETVTARGSEVVFKCLDCGAYLVTKRVRHSMLRKRL